jgi:hypothetical protein
MYWLFALSVFITLGMTLMLYRHFNFLFETQYELTAEVLGLLKEKSPAVLEPNQTDYLYGVSYVPDCEE